MKKKKVLRQFVELSSNKIVILLSFVLFLSVGCYFVYLSRYNHQTPVRKEISATKRIKTICDNPKQKVAETKTFEPVFSKSDCMFSAYSNVAIKELDRASCKRISQYVIVDKNNVYKQLYDPGSSSYNTYAIIKEADIKTFESLGNNYYKDISHLYFDAGNDYKIINGVDVGSVQVLSIHHLKDKNHVFFIKAYGNDSRQNILPGFDVGTFTVIQNYHNHEQYFKDKNGIYFEEQLGGLNSNDSKIVGADTESFEVLSEYLLAKDKSNVYYKGEIIEYLDAPSFEVLPHGYFRDAYGIYINSYQGFKLIVGSDACTFELVDDKGDYDWSGYAKDKNQVYYHESIVDGADSKTFQAKEPKDGIYGGFDKNYEYQGKFRK